MRDNLIPLIRSKMIDVDGDIYGPGLYTTLDPYRYVVHSKSGEDLLTHFHGIFAGAATFALAMRVWGIASIRRSSFDMTSLAPRVFENAVRRGKTVYFIGSKASEVDAAVARIRERFEGLRVVGARDGYLASSQETQAEIKRIVGLAPDIVICGMGVPRQERFLVQLQESGWQGAGYTCGGFLHQTSRRLEYYPPLIDKFHLRWLYRMIDEPRIVVRVITQYIEFIWLFSADLLRQR